MRRRHAHQHTMAGTKLSAFDYPLGHLEEDSMNGIIYIVGLIVVIGVILSFFGLR